MVGRPPPVKERGANAAESDLIGRCGRRRCGVGWPCRRRVNHLVAGRDRGTRKGKTMTRSAADLPGRRAFLAGGLLSVATAGIDRAAMGGRRRPAVRWQAGPRPRSEARGRRSAGGPEAEPRRPARQGGRGRRVQRHGPQVRPAQDRAAGPRLHHQDVLGTGPQAGPVLRGQPRRPAPAERRVGVRPAVADLGHAVRPGPAPRVHRPRQGHVRRGVQGRHPRHQARRAGGHRPHLVGADLRPAAEGPAVHEHLGDRPEEGGRRIWAATRRTCTTARRCGRSSRADKTWKPFKAAEAVPGRDLRRDAGVRPRTGRERLAREQLADARHLAPRLRARTPGRI